MAGLDWSWRAFHGRRLTGWLQQPVCESEHERDEIVHKVHFALAYWIEYNDQLLTNTKLEKWSEMFLADRRVMMERVSQSVNLQSIFESTRDSIDESVVLSLPVPVDDTMREQVGQLVIAHQSKIIKPALDDCVASDRSTELLYPVA